MRYLLCALVLVGCKGGDVALPPPKMNSARATADSLMAAMKAKNLDAIVALQPGADQLAKILDCDVAPVVQRMKEKAEKDLKDIPEGNTVEIGRFDKFGSEDKSFRAGEELEGCKVKAPFTMHTSKVDLNLLHDNKTDFRNVVMRFAQIPGDDKWYYLR